MPKNAKLVKCVRCNGTGTEYHEILIALRCPTCRGKGWVVRPIDCNRMEEVTK